MPPTLQTSATTRNPIPEPLDVNNPERTTQAIINLLEDLGNAITRHHPDPDGSHKFESMCKKGRKTLWKIGSNIYELTHSDGSTESFHPRGIAGLLDRMQNNTSLA